MYESIYHGFLLFCMIVIGLLIMICLLRAIRGPRMADRVVATNMIGTMTIVELAILALYLKENYMYDVCLIYAMISFLAVVVLTKIYQGAYQEKEIKGNLDREETEAEEAAEEIRGKIEEEIVKNTKKKAERKASYKKRKGRR